MERASHQQPLSLFFLSNQSKKSMSLLFSSLSFHLLPFSSPRPPGRFRLSCQSNISLVCNCLGVFIGLLEQVIGTKSLLLLLLFSDLCFQKWYDYNCRDSYYVSYDICSLHVPQFFSYLMHGWLGESAWILFMDALNFEFKPYVGILSSYYIISSYRQHMFILSIMGLHGTNPRELPEKIMSHCFLYIPLFDNLTLCPCPQFSPNYYSLL